MLIYLHIPFCSTKCVFCDWVKEIPASRLQAVGGKRSRYVKGLAAQLRHHGPRIMDAGYTPRLIYWGGGTPTRLDPEELEVICKALHDGFDLSALEEHTVECSPETVTVEKLRTLASYGATRLSIGAQSFDDEELRKAGRAHSSDQVGEAVRCAHVAGFEDVNIDLIAGFPGQSTAVLADGVRRAVDLGPSHMTVYVYRATEGTAMAEQLRRGKRESGGYDIMLTGYEVAREILVASGYHEYAIGYFTRDRLRPCRADQYYFSIEGDYFGFGGGAHSIFAHHFFDNAASRQDAYIDDPVGFSQCERFSVETLSRLLTSLSQTLWIPEGISFERFERLYGIPFSAVTEDPRVQGFMKYYEMCGARFETSATHLRVTPETMVPAYIRALSLYGTQNEGRAVARARSGAVKAG